MCRYLLAQIETWVVFVQGQPFPARRQGLPPQRAACPLYLTSNAAHFFDG